MIRDISGSIDVVTLGSIIYLAGYFGGYWILQLAGASLIVIGAVKVAHDHIFGFEKVHDFESERSNGGGQE